MNQNLNAPRALRFSARPAASGVAIAVREVATASDNSPEALAKAERMALIKNALSSSGRSRRRYC